MDEKLRAFLQKWEVLTRRPWVSSRPRDLYDLWYLWHQTEIAIGWDDVGRILPHKARVRGVSYSGVEDFLDERVLAGIRRDWVFHLQDFVSDLPSFELCLAALRDLLAITVNAASRAPIREER